MILEILKIVSVCCIFISLIGMAWEMKYRDKNRNYFFWIFYIMVFMFLAVL